MPLLVLAGLAGTPASAAAADYAQSARNIIPSGQYGGLPPPAGADDQAQMYDGLTPLFDQVTPAHLNQYFKSERFGVATDGPATPESVPRPGVTIVRDKFNVPHVTATTYSGGIWAAGWIAAKDRGLLLQQARNNARVAAIDAPGLSALGLISGLQNFQPSAQTEAEVAKQTQVLQNAGPEGQAVLQDIDTFISGINDYLDLQQPLDRGLDTQRRLRAQRPEGAVRGRGRRRRGPPLAVPRRPPAAAGAVQGQERLRRPAPVQEFREPDLGRRELQLRAASQRPEGQRDPRPRELRAYARRRERGLRGGRCPRPPRPATP